MAIFFYEPAGVMKNLKRGLLTTTAMVCVAAVLSFAEPVTAYAQEDETQNVTTDVTDLAANTTEDASGETEQASTEDASQLEQDAAQQAIIAAADAVGYEYEFTMEEMVLMANVVYKEARSSFNGQVAVAEVIMNRVMSSAYPNTIKGVLSQKGQFSSYAWASRRTAQETSADMINLCLKVISGEYSYLDNSNVLSFKRNDGSSTFYGKTLYTVVDNQAFYAV